MTDKQGIEVKVARILTVLGVELRKNAWNSILQLILGGAAIYLITVTAGPSYGCGAGNTQLLEGIFGCVRGEMHSAHKFLIVGGVVLASLCWGRAASLYEKRRAAR